MPGRAGHDGSILIGIEVVDDAGHQFLSFRTGNQTTLAHLETMAAELREAQHILQRPAGHQFVQCRRHFGCPVRAGQDRVRIRDILIRRYFREMLQQTERDGLRLRLRIEGRQPVDALPDKSSEGHTDRASSIRTSRTSLTERPAARIWAGTSDIFVMPGTGLISRK